MADFASSSALSEEMAASLEEKVYQTFLQAIDSIPPQEEQYRYFALRCAKRLLDGVEISLRTDILKRDLLGPESGPT